MNFVASLFLIRRRLPLFAAIGALFALDAATAQTSPIQVSPPGQIVAEFSSATAPGNPQLMAASAIKEVTPGLSLCAVYVSRDGGNTWSEVPAWPDTGFQPVFDPWVAIGVDGTIHAVGIARTTEGGRTVYTQSQDQGVSWSPALAVTPFPGKFHRRSADKCCLAVTDDGTIYVAFSQVLTSPVGTSELIVSRSTDQGLTWSTRETGAATLSNGIVATPGGTVTVAIVGGVVPGYGTITSTDGGDTWSAPVSLGEFNVTQGVPLPSIVYDSFGRIVIGDVGGSTTPQLDVSVENADGSIAEQWQLPLPDSNTCGSGRLIQPAVTGGTNRSPAFQVACKVDPTASTEGSLEVWLYLTVDQPALAPILVQSIQLPAQHPPRGFFARRFQDGGDYWSFTWRAAGWLSMWVDPLSGAGPGALLAAPVPPPN